MPRSGEPIRPSCSKEKGFNSLPPDVREAILALLPIKDAVRTSILSRKWRYTWTALPRLVFDEKCIPSPGKDPYLNHHRRVSIVDHVLLWHKGSIDSFKCSGYLESCPEIDRWIAFLSNHGIRELILKFSKHSPYKVPSILFACESLRILRLESCIVQPTDTCTGLANLTILNLFHITINSVALENLLSVCSSLRDLTLVCFEGLTHLKIFAPKLERLHIRGAFHGLDLNTPHLTYAKIHLTDSIGERQVSMKKGQGCNMVKSLGFLPCIMELEVENYFLQLLALGCIPKKLPTRCEHLLLLYLQVDFSRTNQMLAAICLIASAPHLQGLHIHVHSEDQPVDKEFAWEEHNCKLASLEVMIMTAITGSKIELSLLRFVLENARLMKILKIKFAKVVPLEEESKIFKSLIRFRRASTKATIEYIEDDEYKL